MADEVRPESNEDSGHFSEKEVTEAPLERGTDPLGDNAGADDAETVRTRRMGQVVFGTLLGILFLGFLIRDLASADYGRAALGVVVVGLCVVIVVRELHLPKR